MKTLTFSSLIGILAIGLMVGLMSCEKTDVNPTAAPPQDEIKSSQNNESKANGKVTFPMDKFEETFGWYIGFMNSGDVYRIIYDAKTELCTLEEIDDHPNPSETVVCSGNGIGFIRCVKDWLDNNVGDCLCISSDGHNYEANDDCKCP